MRAILLGTMLSALTACGGGGQTQQVSADQWRGFEDVRRMQEMQAQADRIQREAADASRRDALVQ